MPVELRAELDRVGRELLARIDDDYEGTRPYVRDDTTAPFARRERSRRARSR